MSQRIPNESSSSNNLYTPLSRLLHPSLKTDRALTTTETSEVSTIKREASGNDTGHNGAETKPSTGLTTLRHQARTHARSSPLQRGVLPNQKSRVPQLSWIGVVLHQEGETDRQGQRPERDVGDAQVRIPRTHQRQVGDDYRLLPREVAHEKVCTFFFFRVNNRHLSGW